MTMMLPNYCCYYLHFPTWCVLFVTEDLVMKTLQSLSQSWPFHEYKNIQSSYATQSFRYIIDYWFSFIQEWLLVFLGRRSCESKSLCSILANFFLKSATNWKVYEKGLFDLAMVVFYLDSKHVMEISSCISCRTYSPHLSMAQGHIVWWSHADLYESSSGWGIFWPVSQHWNFIFLPGLEHWL